MIRLQVCERVFNRKETDIRKPAEAGLYIGDVGS